MDISETYVKMCEKAEEIQTPWHRHTKSEGDFVYSGKAIKKTKVLGFDAALFIKEVFVWLPRQDQLQMLFSDVCLNVQLIWEYMKSFSGKEGWRPETWEQLWLAFVMKEKYSKQWLQSEEEWVKINP